MWNKQEDGAGAPANNFLNKSQNTNNKRNSRPITPLGQVYDKNLFQNLIFWIGKKNKQYFEEYIECRYCEYELYFLM